MSWWMKKASTKELILKLENKEEKLICGVEVSIVAGNGQEEPRVEYRI